MMFFPGIGFFTAPFIAAAATWFAWRDNKPGQAAFWGVIATWTGYGPFYGITHLDGTFAWRDLIGSMVGFGLLLVFVAVSVGSMLGVAWLIATTLRIKGESARAWVGLVVVIATGVIVPTVVL